MKNIFKVLITSLIFAFFACLVFYFIPDRNNALALMYLLGVVDGTICGDFK